jgi:hypothetical protein
MLPPRPRSQVQYQKPRRINSVSVSLALMVGLLVWVGISAWPAFVVRSNVANELSDALPTLYRLNLRPEAQARPEILKLKRHVTDRIRQAGVTDEKLEISIERSKKLIGLRATYTTVIALKGWKRTFPVRFSPNEQTDAARVDW